MSKSIAKELNKQLRHLRAEWKHWHSGKAAADWWGFGWCAAGAKGQCPEPTCEGCAAVLYCRDRAVEIALKAEALKAQAPAKPMQDPLFE